jgi:hypothetical protein
LTNQSKTFLPNQRVNLAFDVIDTVEAL